MLLYNHFDYYQLISQSRLFLGYEPAALRPSYKADITVPPPPPVCSRQEMLPYLLTKDTRVITDGERSDATNNWGGVVSVPSIIWVQLRLAKWPA